MMDKTNGWDVLRTLLRGLIGIILVLGILYLLFYNTKDFETDYSKCIFNCPKSFGGTFSNLECPNMCAKLSNQNCNNLSYLGDFE